MAQIERKTAEFEDFKRFQIESRSYSKQFYGIYNARFSSLKHKTTNRANSKWSKNRILKIVDSTKDEHIGVPCTIIGILYKHQELKPSVLKEMFEELQAELQPVRLNYCSSSDVLFLEDDMSRIKLVGVITPDIFVTGLTCAVFGHGLSNGTFWVEDFCFPGPFLKSLDDIPSGSTKDHGKLLLFLSGLDLENEEGTLEIEILTDWVTGLIGNELIQKEAASIVHIIIAGNSVRGCIETFTRKGYFENRMNRSLFSKNIQRAVYKLDCLLSEIAKSCSVILLPGEFDPSCHSIPQHAIHPKILPASLNVGNVHGVTNPWIGKIGSRIVSGSSGQPILDIMKVSKSDLSPLNWLEKTIEWQHFAPTAPDTLANYPFDQLDPLVMNDLPNIYFVGNMEKYETKLLQASNRNDEYEGHPIRLICIPKFSTSHTAILVDLETLNTRPISFGTIPS